MNTSPEKKKNDKSFFDDEDDDSFLSKKTSKKHSSDKISDRKNTDTDSQSSKSAFFANKKEAENSKPASIFESKTNTDNEKSTSDKVEDKNDKSSSEIDHTKTPEQDPVEELSDSEVKDVLGKVIDTRTSEVQQELHEAQDGSVEEFEAVADAIFLHAIQERLDEHDEITEDDMTTALEAALNDIGIEDAREQESLIDDSAETEDIDIATDDSRESDTPEDTVESEPPTDSNDSDHSSSSSTPPPPPPPVSPGAPPPPSPPGSTTPFSAGGGSPPARPQQHNQLNGARPNQATNTPERRRGRDLLVGALVGYVLGRRGGRKRTEARLQPEIKKLENQVGVLHDAILEKEEKMRKLARKLAEQQTEPTSELTKKAVKSRVERTKKIELKKKQENLKNNPIVEKLGAMNLNRLGVLRESRVIDDIQTIADRKPVEIMTIPELIEKMAGVVIDGVSVVTAFKAGRIDSKTLREITKHYLRGGSYEARFRKELKSSPSSFETDKNATPITRSIAYQNDLNMHEQLPQTAQANSDASPRYTQQKNSDVQNSDNSKVTSKSKRAPFVVVVAIFLLLLLLVSL